MLKIHLLGHVYVTWNMQTVQVSGKAAAMLTYLALEKRAHHREHLAELLWDHPRALRNLRVELARLKQLGLNLFPERQPMLSLRCETDLDMLEQDAPTVNERQLPGWLSALRATPLSGLDDLCSPAYQNWVDQQRCVIAEQLETVLSEVWTRFQHPTQRQQATLILERAKQLGLDLPERPSSPSPTRELHFAYPEQEEELARLLALAHDAPQLLLLRGQSGAKHDLIHNAVRGSVWQTVQLQASSPRRLVQAALLQQLSRLAASSPQRAAELLTVSADPDADLIRATQFLSEANLPLVLSLHGLKSVESWLVNGIRFALDLRVPLLLVVSSASGRVLSDLRQSLGHMDWGRLHEMNLPSLGIQGVARALQVRAQGQSTPAPLHHKAARLAQHSDGWPLHIKLMSAQPGAAVSPPYSLPDRVSQSVLAELPPLPSVVLGGLQRLTQVMDRISPELARTLLGESCEAVLNCASQYGLLIPASLHEHVHLPGLNLDADEAEVHLTFCSEHTREALASLLSAPERQALAEQLAQVYQISNPPLSALYAERAGQHDLARSARERRAPADTIQPRLTAASALAPVPRPHPRQELRTGNSYRVAVENGQLEVLRKGRPRPSPNLTLHFPDQPPGHWEMIARLDVYEPFLPGHFPAQYALGLGAGGQTQALYSAEAILCDPDLHEDLSALHTELVPKGTWFTVSGNSPGGAVTLSSRARHLALTIGSFTWNQENLIPTHLEAMD